MKRVGYIYEGICDLDNIKTAVMKASLGKRHQKRVKYALNNIDKVAVRIRKMLMNKTYRPSPYVTKTIYDGTSRKKRTICKPRFYPDQIIHWALMLQTQPIIMKGMYKYNCGSIPGRGTSYGQKILRKWLDADYRNTKYCLKLDISKFYPSIDNDMLKRMFRARIKDKNCLWLIDTIIDSGQGLPIGNYTSQWFSNFYLQGLDHFIKEELRVKYYIRYVDDLVLLGANKKKLHQVRMNIAVYLDTIGLRLKDDWQVFKVNSRAIDFLGLRFFRHKTILRKRNALRIRRRVRRISKKQKLAYRDACAVISYWGWIKRSDSYRFYHRHFKPYININKAKKVVSSYDKARNLRTNTGIRPNLRRGVPDRTR